MTISFSFFYIYLPLCMVQIVNFLIYVITTVKKSIDYVIYIYTHISSYLRSRFVFREFEL